MRFEIFLYSLIIFLILFFFLKKFDLLNENSFYSSHKKFIKNDKNPLLMGGLFLLIIIILFLDTTLVIKIIFISITLLGFLSDRNIMSNPSLRLIIQLFLIFFFVYSQSLSIEDLRNFYLNQIIENKFSNFIFVSFCLAILINGSNFMDGLNGLLTGYSSMILLSILFLSLFNNNINILYYEFLFLLLFSLSIILVFNFFGFIYLGDSGSYLISIFLGFYLIELFKFNPNLSPYYIALVLWYPAFENLFSLSRRILKKSKVTTPDNNHLHQLLYVFLKDKKIFKINVVNPSTSIIILLFNLPSFIIGTIYSFNSNLLIFLICLNIFLYLISYLFLFKILKR